MTPQEIAGAMALYSSRMDNGDVKDAEKTLEKCLRAMLRWNEDVSLNILYDVLGQKVHAENDVEMFFKN